VKVIDMRGMRDLLADLDEMRARILQGRIKAWAACLTDDEGEQAVYLGGRCKTDPAEAARAGMQIAWAMSEMQAKVPEKTAHAG
jgi:hypothetical protein